MVGICSIMTGEDPHRCSMLKDKIASEDEVQAITFGMRSSRVWIFVARISWSPLLKRKVEKSGSGQVRLASIPRIIAWALLRSWRIWEVRLVRKCALGSGEEIPRRRSSWYCCMTTVPGVAVSSDVEHGR